MEEKAGGGRVGPEEEEEEVEAAATAPECWCWWWPAVEKEEEARRPVKVAPMRLLKDIWATVQKCY